MFKQYIIWNPRGKTMAQVQQAGRIIEEYQQAGYVLTLRQLYYQFVARDLLPNTERSYKNLVTTITKARMAGLISWRAIEDRNRGVESYWYDEDILSPVIELPGYIRFDRWARQDYYVEVWVEKEALGNVIARACNLYLVPHLSCKGYLSASEAWRAGRRFRTKIQQGKKCVLIHLGDHDPSGIDMTRDNRDRVDLFSEFPQEIQVNRIALNIDQIKKYKPPPNPTKLTDSRAGGYIQNYGKTSWELDALEPSIMETMIVDEIRKYIDFNQWNSVNKEENEIKRILANIGKRWDMILPIVEEE